MELLDTLSSRGLAVVVDDGKPSLKGPKDMVTEPLMRMVKMFREELIETFADKDPDAEKPLTWEDELRIMERTAQAFKDQICHAKRSSKSGAPISPGSLSTGSPAR